MSIAYYTADAHFDRSCDKGAHPRGLGSRCDNVQLATEVMGIGIAHGIDIGGRSQILTALHREREKGPRPRQLPTASAGLLREGAVTISLRAERPKLDTLLYPLLSSQSEHTMIQSLSLGKHNSGWVCSCPRGDLAQAAGAGTLLTEASFIRRLPRCDLELSTCEIQALFRLALPSIPFWLLLML